MSTPIINLGFVAGQNLTDSLFDPAELAAAETLLQQYLIDNFPTMNVGQNATLYDLNLRARAVIYMISRAEWTALRATMSLQGILDNPSLASAAVLDAILSNYLITRRSGTPASGIVQIVVSSTGTYIIPAGTVFSTLSGQTYTPGVALRALASPSLDGDLPLYSSGVGQFYFLVPVTATLNGSAAQIQGRTALTCSTPIPNLMLCQAFGDFSGGSDDETNEALIARIPEAQSAKNQVSRLSIAATLKQRFPSILDVSVQSMGDPAMTRNSHNLLGIKTGGYADLYLRTSATILTGSMEKTAFLVSIGSDGNATYQVNFLRDDFPGYYFVSSILPSGSTVGSYQILSEVAGFNSLVDPDGNATGTRSPNLIVTTQEGAYSRFQTSTVQFQVDYDPTLGNSPADQFDAQINVRVAVGYLPDISAIQQFVSDPQTGVFLADYLVRAAIPCLVGVSTLTIHGSSSLQEADIQTAVCGYVNSLKMGQPIRIDSLVSCIRSVAGVDSVDLPILLTGQLYAPGGSVLNLSSNNTLQVPQRPDLQVVPENTAFFINPSDVQVALIVA